MDSGPVKENGLYTHIILTFLPGNNSKPGKEALFSRYYEATAADWK